MAQTQAQKAKIKAAKDALRDGLRTVLAMEDMLLEAKIAAAMAVARLIKDAEDPGPHKIRLGPDSVALYTFRKEGEYMGDKDGAPVKPGADGKLPEGAKPFPFYAVKVTDLSDEDNE